jgi:hypothetical protein
MLENFIKFQNYKIKKIKKKKFKEIEPYVIKRFIKERF